METQSLAYRVHDAFRACLFLEDEIAAFPGGKPPESTVFVETIRGKFGFHPERLEQQRALVVEIIEQLPREFRPDGGGGYSFLKLPFLADSDFHWAEHPTCDEFLGLAFGLGLGGFLLPRDLWSIMPGGMPYLWLDPAGKLDTATV